MHGRIVSNWLKMLQRIGRPIDEHRLQTLYDPIEGSFVIELCALYEKKTHVV